MSLALKLVSFDEPLVEPAKSGPSDDYLKGFEDGAAAARAIAEKQQDQLRSELVASLSDLTFGYHEARSSFAQTLRPIFTAISDQIVPAVLKETLAHHLIETFETVAAGALDGQITILMNPQDAETLGSDLTGQIPTVAIVADATVPLGTAVIGNGSSETIFDPTDLIKRIQNALGALTDIHTNEAIND